MLNKKMFENRFIFFLKKIKSTTSFYKLFNRDVIVISIHKYVKFIKTSL